MRTVKVISPYLTNGGTDAARPNDPVTRTVLFARLLDQIWHRGMPTAPILTHQWAEDGPW